MPTTIMIIQKESLDAVPLHFLFQMGVQYRLRELRKHVSQSISM